MHESITYQAVLEEGCEEGREEGRSIVINLLREGTDIALIAWATVGAIAQIEALANE